MPNKPIEVSVLLENGKLTITQVFEPTQAELQEDDCAFVAAQVAAALHQEFPLQYNWFPVKDGYRGKAR